MKKILVLAIIAIATVSNSFALDLNEYKVFYKLNDEKTFNSLARYLDVTDEQGEKLKYVFSLTENKLKNALDKENEIAAEKAMWFNLGNAKLILSEEQYKKYLTTINLSVYVNNQEFFAEK
ncbi:MAG: hypothetical protein LLF95_12310 [Bacteroidales bacterium]|nr:hypothetical protein [Bacteroidales bacterium]